MYPGTIFNWYDQSEIYRDTAPVELDNSPLFMVVGSFDKGPENLREVSAAKFNALYGTMNFSRHGQNAIQTQRIIDAGARVLIKRVCAQDATLANIVIVATVTAGTDANTASVKWEAKSISNCKTFEEVKAEAMKLLDENQGIYPVFIISDNGRGKSGKAFRLIPDYNTSKSIAKMFYTATVFEGTMSLESVPATVDPTIISNESYALEKGNMNQIDAEVVDVAFDAYISDLSNKLGVEKTALRTYDVIYGYTYSGAKIAGFTLDEESVDLNTDYGIGLKEGTNGAFGDAPADKNNTEANAAWVEEIRKVYAGEATDEVWDVDQHKVAAICDANFPITIKEAIANFVNYRKDCMFFRDLGTGLKTFLEIKAAYDLNETRSKFIADYFTSYMVKDPATKKNIEVTMMYDFVECLAAHLASGPSNPVAGSINNFILRSAIKGTVNFTPIVTPTVNQKQAVDDIRLNYAIFEDDDCIVQTLYTSQPKFTELSFINNVLAIQEVARAIRTACPKQRYSTVSGYDLTSYAKAVNNILSNFAGNFSTLRFTYTKDKLRASQRIFYATIEFAFNQWAQTEVFDLFAINNE